MRNIMVQGTSSGAGKSMIVAALCRIFSDLGYKVAPFKSQNMSRHSYLIPDRNLEISSAQALQAVAARCDITSDLNPILLKPQGNLQSAVYVNGLLHGVMDAARYYDAFALSGGLAAAKRALASLSGRFDLIVLEGAGSPAEINLAAQDIANMRMAHLAGDASVVLACDIDRGGAFASLAGTVSLLPKDDARLVRGFVLNKFRGDVSILKPGCDMLHDMTGVPVMGIIPMLDLSGLPDEDSLDARADAPLWDSGSVPRHVEDGLLKLVDGVKNSLDLDALVSMIEGGRDDS